MPATYLRVMASFDEAGNIVPLAFKWPDGRTFRIDGVVDKRQAASRKGGGCGIRYVCRVMGREVILFLDENKWFYEPREGARVIL